MAHLNQDLLLKMSHSFLIVFHMPQLYPSHTPLEYHPSSFSLYFLAITHFHMNSHLIVNLQHYLPRMTLLKMKRETSNTKSLIPFVHINSQPSYQMWVILKRTPLQRKVHLDLFELLTLVYRNNK